MKETEFEYDVDKIKHNEDFVKFITKFTCVTNINIDFKDKWDDVKFIISCVDERIRYWDKRRNGYFVYFSSLLPIALTLLQIILKVKKLSFFQCISFVEIYIILISTLIFYSLLGLNKWNKQNNPVYSFNKSFRTWRWQYRHSEKEPLNVGAKKCDIDFEVSKYNTNLADFIKKYCSTSIQDLYIQDIAQLYLCIINEKYKITYISEFKYINKLLFFSICYVIIFSILIEFAFRAYKCFILAN